MHYEYKRHVSTVAMSVDNKDQPQIKIKHLRDDPNVFT